MIRSGKCGTSQELESLRIEYQNLIWFMQLLTLILSFICYGLQVLLKVL